MFLIPPRSLNHDFNLRLVLGDVVRGQKTAPVHGRIDDGAAAEDAAGVQHAVAAHFRAVTDERAKLAQAGVQRFALDHDGHVAGQRLEVGADDARAGVRLVAEDGIADVIEVRHLTAVEEQRVLQLGGIAHDAVVADDDVFADVGVVPDLAIFPDDGGAFDHRAVFDNRALTNKNFLSNVGLSSKTIPQRKLRRPIDKRALNVGGQVRLDLLERFPRVMAAVEEGGVFGLREIEQFGNREVHAGRLGELRLLAKGNDGGDSVLASLGELN